MSSAVVPSTAAAASGADVARSFQAVFIPADAARSVEQWTIEYNNASEVSCLMDRLKAHFASGGMKAEDQAALREKVRAQIKDTLAKQNPAAADKPIDDAMVNMILQMSSVDCVPLQNNKHSTGYIGVMMYVDDQGKAKNLSVNERATRVTMECGIPTSVLGDAVIARNFDDENHFRRVDFTLEEYFKHKEWRLSAQRANKEREGQGDKAKELQALIQKQRQSAVSGADIAQQLDAASARQAAAAAAATSAPAAVKLCSNPACERDASMRCSRCRLSSYCSAACQKADFKFHKKNVCVQKDAAAPTAATDAQTTAAAAEKPAQ